MATPENSNIDLLRPAPEFYGCFTVAIEEPSGRFLTPLRWRPKEPDDWFGVILWPIGVESHLLVLPPARWNRLLSYLQERATKEGEQAAQERVVGQTSEVVHLDKLGRIAIREELLKRIGVEKEVVLAGRVTKWEIYSPKGFSPATDLEKKAVAEIFEDFAP